MSISTSTWSEEEWSVTVERGEREVEGEASAPCDGTTCAFRAGQEDCSARSEDYYCTLPRGHAGPHVACCGSVGLHNLHVWPSHTNAPLPLSPVEVDDLHRTLEEEKLAVERERRAQDYTAVEWVMEHNAGRNTP